MSSRRRTPRPAAPFPVHSEHVVSGDHVTWRQAWRVGGRRHVASALRGRARAGLRPLQLEREPEPGVAGAGAGVRAGARPGCSAAWQRHGPSCSRDLSGRVGTYSNVVVRPASTLEAAPTRRKRPPRNFFSLRTRKKFRAATR